MWSDIVKKNKNKRVTNKKSKGIPKNNRYYEDSDSDLDSEPKDLDSDFDLLYYDKFESLLNPILTKIQYGPVFKHGLADDLINYIKINL